MVAMQPAAPLSTPLVDPHAGLKPSTLDCSTQGTGSEGSTGGCTVQLLNVSLAVQFAGVMTTTRCNRTCILCTECVLGQVRLAWIECRAKPIGSVR